MGKPIDIECGYDEPRPIFHLRRTSVAADNKYIARLGEIPANETEEKRAEMLYDIYVDSIADWSVSVPTKKQTVKGVTSEVPYIDGIDDPAEAVRKIFEVRNEDTELMPMMIVGDLRQRRLPFLG